MDKMEIKTSQAKENNPMYICKMASRRKGSIDFNGRCGKIFQGLRIGKPLGGSTDRRMKTKNHPAGQKGKKWEGIFNPENLRKVGTREGGLVGVDLPSIPRKTNSVSYKPMTSPPAPTTPNL